MIFILVYYNNPCENKAFKNTTVKDSLAVYRLISIKINRHCSTVFDVFCVIF